MSYPKVSVIIPCYGVEKYLDRCMESVMNQTLHDIEIILVDDGSPDRVPEMCDEYARRDPRIKVIHKANAGLGYARNSGLDIATGEYVAFVDSDDYIDLRMYEALYTTAKKSHCDVVYCGFHHEGASGFWQKSEEVSELQEWQGDKIKIFMLDMVASHHSVNSERRYYMSVWHSIYKLNAIQTNNIRFLSEREVASEDIPFQVDFLKSVSKVAYLPENYYYYCSNSTSLTATYKSEKYDRFKKLYGILKNKLKDIEDGHNRANRFFIGYTRTQLHHLMLSNYSTKRAEISRIVNDPIWQELRKEYPAENYSRIDIKLMYLLILNKKIILLYLNSKIINFLRKITKLR